MSATSACGDFLDTCTCSRRDTSIPRRRFEIEARHQAAVARAVRSGWADVPVPGWLISVLLPSETSATRRAA